MVETVQRLGARRKASVPVIDVSGLVVERDVSILHGIDSVSYTHLTLPTTPYV